jgi:hypothetical protein
MSDKKRDTAKRMRIEVTLCSQSFVYLLLWFLQLSWYVAVERPKVDLQCLESFTDSELTGRADYRLNFHDIQPNQRQDGFELQLILIQNSTSTSLLGHITGPLTWFIEEE